MIGLKYNCGLYYRTVRAANLNTVLQERYLTRENERRGHNLAGYCDNTDFPVRAEEYSPFAAGGAV